MDIARIIIVDDHVIFRKGLTTVLNEIDFVKVVGEASNGSELLEMLKKQSADLILMDIKMPVMDGVEATRRVGVKYPGLKVIALTIVAEISYFNKMVEAGATGFLLEKTTSSGPGYSRKPVRATRPTWLSMPLNTASSGNIKTFIFSALRLKNPHKSYPTGHSAE